MCQNRHMTRRYVIVLALVGSACGHLTRSGNQLLPPAIGGVWHRASLRDIAPPNNSIVGGFQAAYEGPGKLTVDLYEAKVSATAFEMVQHWRAVADTIVFDEGKYFVTVKWEHADRQALTGFVRILQKQLEE